MSSEEAPSEDPQEEAAAEVAAAEAAAAEAAAAEVAAAEVAAAEAAAAEAAEVPIEEHAVHIPATVPPPSPSGERERGSGQRTGWLLDMLDDVRYLITCTNWY